MHWKFVPYFSIKIVHEKYPSIAGQPAPVPPEFTVKPTEETSKRLLQYGWIPKDTGGACTVYAEHLIDENGAAQLRKKPASGEGFSFIIHLLDAGILNETSPYVIKVATQIVPNPALPAFSGRSRILYFDNLNATVQSDGSYSLNSGNPVGTGNMGSVLPVPVSVKAASASVSGIDMQSLTPGGTITHYPLSTQNRVADINLPESGYRIAQQPLPQQETVYLSPNWLPPTAFGVVRIFEPAGGWEPYKVYQIAFAKPA